ncbi:MAG: hypothetical protein U9N59_08660 [Campylobacterota bacterium]|nr:hypothetical protein [Campylobacterota bacterium]
MSHKLSTQHKNMCKKIQNYKNNNKENKDEFFLILEEPTLNLILKADITATSKTILVFLLSKLHFNYKHLYIYLPYKLLEKETGIKKPTAINSLKDLDTKGFIKLHSGTNRIENNNIKKFIFEQEQFYNPMRNQQNIIEMTQFFNKLFKVEK